MTGRLGQRLGLDGLDYEIPEGANRLSYMLGGLAGLIFLLIVTGTALRYDQEGFEALAHLVAGSEMTGWFGGFFTEGFTVSTPLLSRIYGLHTSLLPLAVVALMGVHFWLVRQLGIHASAERTKPFWPVLWVYGLLGETQQHIGM